VVDGHKGLVDAINTVFLNAALRTCIVHLIRSSLDYAGWKDRKLVAQALRPICTAVSEEAAQEELKAFASGPWGIKCGAVLDTCLGTLHAVLRVLA
jgi:putative transposase